MIKRISNGLTTLCIGAALFYVLGMVVQSVSAFPIPLDLLLLAKVGGACGAFFGLVWPE